MIRLLVWLIARVAPAGAQAWVQAMHAEIAAIDDARTARRFARGCLRAALVFRVRAVACRPTRASRSHAVPTRLLMTQVNCGAAAAAIGVLHLVVAGAPVTLLIVNVMAFLLGLLLLVAARRVPDLPPALVNGLTVAVAAALLLTALVGSAVDGVTRWVQVGAFSVQTSLVLVPAAVVLFAQTVNRWTTTAMIAIAGALALQPDRAMACALGAGLLAVLFVRRTPAAAIASGAAAAAVLVTLLRPDPVPAVPFVDHILWSSFSLSPWLGLALWLGSALLFVPLLLSRSAGARPVCLAGGACWAAIVGAAAAGAYPTPVVGYGGAAILGYFLCLAALGAQCTPMPAAGQATSAAHSRRAREGDDADHREYLRPSGLRSAGAPAWLTQLHVVRVSLLCAPLLLGAPRRTVAQAATDECARTPVEKVESPGVWQPGPDGRQLPLWPDGHVIDEPATGGRPEYVGNGSPLVAGRLWHWATYVARPTMTIYRPTTARSRAAIVVLPGGGYAAVAMDLEGTEICDWITSLGVTCVLLKYRVPQVWPRGAHGVRQPPARQLPLEDAQRAIGLLRAGAAEYGLDPGKIGVIGFSAGGHLAAAVSNAERRTYAPTDAADRVRSIPDFAILLYPGRLWNGRSREGGLPLAPWMTISRKAPPTLLIHAMNDPVDDVRHSMAYGLALHEAGVPVDMRLHARGCHAFGLRPTSDPITTEWPDEVVRWLRQLGVVPISERP